MELVVEKSVKVEDGLHQGIITKVEFRTGQYKYMDVVIMCKEAGAVELKCGYPHYLTPESKLGQFLSKFVGQLVEGVSIDPEKILVNQPVQFQTIGKKAKNGKEYATIIPESVKPLKVQQ